MKKRTMTELEYTQAKVVGGTAVMVSLLAELAVLRDQGLPYGHILAKVSGGIGGLDEKTAQLMTAIQKLTLE